MGGKMKPSLSILAIMIVIFMLGFLSGCEDFDLSGCDCEKQIDDLVDERGEPDDQEFIFENGVNTLTYWYNSAGFAQTFRWGEGTDLCCETTYSTMDNQAPVAQNQSVFTEVNTSVNITLTATDVDGDSLNYQVLTQPRHGTLSGVAPDLNYIPNTNFVGNDSFTFKANDGRLDSLAATVQITVASSGNGGTEPPEPEPPEPEPPEPEPQRLEPLDAE